MAARGRCCGFKISLHKQNKIKYFFKLLICAINLAFFCGFLEKLLMMSSNIAGDWFQPALSPRTDMEWYWLPRVLSFFHFNSISLPWLSLIAPPLTIRRFSVPNISEPLKKAPVPVKCLPEQVEFIRKEMPLLWSLLWISPVICLPQSFLIPFLGLYMTQ